MPMLRDFKIGDTVLLTGALSFRKPMVVGDITRDGRSRLWVSLADKEAGLPWLIDAAGSHGASDAQA